MCFNAAHKVISTGSRNKRSRHGRNASSCVRFLLLCETNTKQKQFLFCFTFVLQVDQKQWRLRHPVLTTLPQNNKPVNKMGQWNKNTVFDERRCHRLTITPICSPNISCVRLAKTEEKKQKGLIKCSAERDLNVLGLTHPVRMSGSQLCGWGPSRPCQGPSAAYPWSCSLSAIGFLTRKAWFNRTDI